MRLRKLVEFMGDSIFFVTCDLNHMKRNTNMVYWRLLGIVSGKCIIHPLYSSFVVVTQL